MIKLFGDDPLDVRPRDDEPQPPTFGLALSVRLEQRIQLLHALRSADGQTVIRAGEQVTVRLDPESNALVTAADGRYVQALLREVAE